MIEDAALEWVRQRLHPQRCASAEFIYNLMDSQSGYGLPVVYQPFDPQHRGHLVDRGRILDYYCSIGGGRLLDFGPGDGWPSLPLAPLAEHVTGVDAAPRRVEICRANAARLGLDNTSFVHAPPGARLPFDDASFDGAAAASSVEQTPDPLATLRELARVLKPGGRLRLCYEGLEQYRGGREREWLLLPADAGSTHLLLFDRHLEAECADQYRIDLALPAARAQQLVAAASGLTPPAAILHSAGKEQLVLSPVGLRELAQYITGAAHCRTRHPGGRAMVELLERAGFSRVLATHNGGDYADGFFADMPPELLPRSLAEADSMLIRAVRIVCHLPAPIAADPQLTAVK